MRKPSALRCPSCVTIMVGSIALFLIWLNQSFQPTVVPRKIRRQSIINHVFAEKRSEPSSRRGLTPQTIASAHHSRNPTATHMKMVLTSSQAALASQNLIPYDTAETEFICEPNLTRSRPTRKLDYVVPPDSAEWPQNCQGREELCDVLRRTAVEREVMVALCNSAVIGQLSKWLDANRRAGVTNIMIIALDSRLSKWLDENKVRSLAERIAPRAAVKA